MAAKRPVPVGVKRGPEPDVWEDVPVSAHGRQGDVHTVGSVEDNWPRHEH